MSKRHKFTDTAVRAKLLEALSQGAYINAACAYAGINKDTFYDWQKKAEAGSTPHQKFMTQVADAEADAEQKVVAGWIAVTDPAHPKFDWRANRDFLARRFPDRWMERRRLEVEDHLDRQIAELERELAQQERRRAAAGEDTPQEGTRTETGADTPA